jgi:hypothetical protein
LPERRNPILANINMTLHRRAKSAVLGIAHAAGYPLESR